VWLKGQSIGNFTDNMFNRADFTLKILNKWKRRKVKLVLNFVAKGTVYTIRLLTKLFNKVVYGFEGV
jgi:hypothetical protein